MPCSSTPGGESLLERRFLALMRHGGLPRPEAQAIQRGNGQHIARVDFLFREQQVVVEVTGRLGHSTPSERGRDAQRRNELLNLGLRVYEYTWAHLTQRGPWVVTTVRQRLASCQQTGSGTST